MNPTPGRNRLVQQAVQRYESALTNYAWRLTGNLDTAREVVQEAFLRLCREDRTLQNGHLAPWLYTVCRHRALDRRGKDKSMILQAQTAFEALPSNEDPATLAEDQEGNGRVAKALAELPENQREVIQLRFQDELSYKQIAEVTQLSTTNVGFLIHTGIRTLRKLLRTSTSETGE